MASELEVFAKYLAFGGALQNMSGFNLENASGGSEYSAFKRVYYIIETIEDFWNLENYVSINRFQFREGFFLSLVSVNVTLGLLLLLYCMRLSILFLNRREYVITFAIFAWLFVLPVFDPLIICLLIYNTQLNQANYG